MKPLKKAPSTFLWLVTAALLSTVALCGSSCASEIDVALTPLLAQAVVPDSVGMWKFTDSLIQKNRVGALSGIMFDMPFEYDGAEGCNSKQGAYEIFDMDLPQQTWVGTDTTRVGEFALFYQPASRSLIIHVTEYPITQGLIYTKPLTYFYPVLDQVPLPRQAPFTDLCKAGQHYALSIRLYLSRYMTIVQVKLAGSPFYPVLVSPVSFGLGETLFEALTTQTARPVEIDGYTEAGRTTTVLPREVMVYGLYYDMSEGISASESNVKDDINLNFGAKAFPVPAPFLYQGIAAPAATMVPLY